MMESKIQKQLIDYFSFFDEFHTAAKSTLRDCQYCAGTINKLIKRCKNIQEAKVEASPLAPFQDLQNKLCAQLHNLISRSIYDLRAKQPILEDLVEKLFNKNKVLRESCREIDLNEDSLLVKGSPTQPSLRKLLEYADDTITFASHICAQTKTALNILTYTKLDTDLLGEHFCYPYRWTRRTADIIRYTSFLFENPV